MNTNGNCPTLTSTEETKAPWNDKSPYFHKFDVTVSQSLSKEVEVCTNDYAVKYDKVEKEEFLDTFDTDWKTAYANEHLSIIELLDILKDFVQKEIDTGKGDQEYLKYILEECGNWNLDETEIVE